MVHPCHCRHCGLWLVCSSLHILSPIYAGACAGPSSSPFSSWCCCYTSCALRYQLSQLPVFAGQDTSSPSSCSQGQVFSGSLLSLNADSEAAARVRDYAPAQAGAGPAVCSLTSEQLP
jgi:hypothetical protein